MVTQSGHHLPRGSQIHRCRTAISATTSGSSAAGDRCNFLPLQSSAAAGANIVGVTGNSGDTGGNTTILDKTNPRVVMAFGAFIQNISPSPLSNGAGGRRIRLTFMPGYANNMSLVVKVQALTGHGQAAALGIWNCVKIDGNSFDLATNVTTGLPSAWDSSDPYRGPGGEAISQATNIAVYIYNQGRFSGFTDLVFCKSANEPSRRCRKDCRSRPDRPAAISRSRPGCASWICLPCRRATRMTSREASLQLTRIIPVRVAAMFRIIGLARSSVVSMTPTLVPTRPRQRAGPTSTTKSIQGIIDFPNTGNNPTLNVNGRGAKYIYDFDDPASKA